MVVIIHGRGRPYGALSGFTAAPRTFTADDVHFLQSVANVLAAAIERQQLEEELLAASGREQRRIGQDLHDGLCQQLSGIQFVTELIARELPDALAQKGKVAEVAEKIRDAILHTRMLARGLSPVELEAHGLMSALQELTSDAETLFRISCRFEAARPVLIRDNAAATHLYRIAQEAIHNAIRHGQAKHVRVRLGSVEDVCTLSITDDGAGLSPAFDKSHGMGLRIMNYRAEAIGGAVKIVPAQGRGTAVVCTFKI